jgi:DNA-binding PadR family transcriptional regulator
MFEVLVSLAETDRHGYAILKDIADRTAGRVTLSTGTLYGIIKRLLGEGLVAEARRRPAAKDDDERRRYYRLAPFGRAVVAAEADRLESALNAARAAGIPRMRRA